MKNLNEEINCIEQNFSKYIIEVHSFKEMIINISKCIDETGFWSLIKIIKHPVVKDLISDGFVKQYIDILFSFVDKFDIKDGELTLYYQHWIVKFGSDNEIYITNKYQLFFTPSLTEIEFERMNTQYYRFLRTYRQYYRGIISLKMLINKNYNSNYLLFLKDKKNNTKRIITEKIENYDDETRRICVQAKLKIHELNYEKIAYDYLVSEIKKVLPNSVIHNNTLKGIFK